MVGDLRSILIIHWLITRNAWKPQDFAACRLEPCAGRDRCGTSTRKKGVRAMSHLKLVRLVGAVVVLAGIAWLPVAAQTQAPSPPSPSAPAPAERAEQMSRPPGAVQPGTAGKSTAAP